MTISIREMVLDGDYPSDLNDVAGSFVIRNKPAMRRSSWIKMRNSDDDSIALNSGFKHRL